MQGVLFLLGSQLAWAIGALFLKKLTDGVQPLVASSLIALFGAIAMLPVMLYFSKDISSISTEEWGSAALRGILWIAVGGALYAYGLSKTDLTNAALIALSYPFFTALLGLIVLNEQLSVRFIIASFLFLAGYLVLSWQ
jgi:drug/metabolite transporter (DMT)-like permease